MTNTNKTLIAVVMDRSGSMGVVQDATIEGFNSFLKTQKETPGDCVMYYTQFDDEYEIVHKYVSLQDMPFLTRATYQPRGWTALYDAIANTIIQVGKDLAALSEEERPGRVLFVIQTDGQENRSVEYKNRDVIKKMIETQKNQYSWDFVFLGANIDAPAVANSIGIDLPNSMTYGHNRVGTASAFASMGSNVATYRSTTVREVTTLGFSDKQRKEANS